MLIRYLFRCQLGEKRTYSKLKKKSICYNGREYKHEQNAQTCKCDKFDFKCDFGYKRDSCKLISFNTRSALKWTKADNCVPDDTQRKADHICIDGKKDDIITKVK